MSDQSWKRLKEAHDQLNNGDSVTDEELIDVATNLNIMTNAEYAAYLLVSAIAPICGYRPHLTESLLYEPILPLIYAGIETPEGVIAWLQYYLNKPIPFNDMEATGINWIRWLITQPQLIQKYLDQEIEKNDALLLEDAQTLERFAPYSEIPMDRILFRPVWRDNLLAHTGKFILFFEIPVDDEEHQVPENQQILNKFQLLTEVLAIYDPQGKLEFIVLDYEGYWSYLRHIDHGKTKQKLPAGVDPKNVQILWLFGQKLIHSVNPDTVADKLVYEKNTLDLISAS